MAAESFNGFGFAWEEVQEWLRIRSPDLFQSRPGLVTAWSCRRLGVFAAIMILVSWACRPCVDSMGYIYTYTYIYIYVYIMNK